MPFFGTMRLMALEGDKAISAAPRFAGWAVAGAVGGGWFIWPALTPAFFRNPFGIYGELEAEPEPEPESVKVDYSATGALRTFETQRPKKFNKFVLEDVDAMPENVTPPPQRERHEETTGSWSNTGIAGSVDALRTFKTRVGTKEDWVQEDVDSMPIPKAEWEAENGEGGDDADGDDADDDDDDDEE